MDNNLNSNSLDNDKPHTGLHIEDANNSSVSSTRDAGHPEDIDDDDFGKREAAVVFKLDCFIAPVMMLLMLISYLDRGNVRAIPYSRDMLDLLCCCSWLMLSGSCRSASLRRRACQRILG